MAKTRVMKPKASRPALTADDIQVGKSFRGKNPSRPVGSRLLNDRTVIHISPSRIQVQYDGPAVKDGQHYPKVSMEAFLKWASHEVFDTREEEPSGEEKAD